MHGRAHPRPALASLVLLAGGLLSPAALWADESVEATGAEAAMQTIERHAVLVAVRFQRDVGREEHGATPPDPRGRAERYRFWRLSTVVPGLVVRDRRTVLIADLLISPTAVASVEVRVPGGPSVPARLRGFLRDVDAMVVETTSDLPLDPVSFERGDALPRYAGSVAESGASASVWVERVGRLRRRPVGADVPHAYDMPDPPFGSLSGAGGAGQRTADLVLDEAARPLGLRFGDPLGGERRWRGADLLAEAEIPLDVLGETAARLAAASPLHRVQVAFRTAPRRERSGASFFLDAGKEDEEAEAWGLAVTPDLLLVPGRLEDEQIRKIRSVRVDDHGEGGRRGGFAGRVRGLQAFLVRVEDGGLEPLAQQAPAAPGPGGALLVHRVGWRGGSRRDQVDLNRVAGWGRGYGDRLHLATETAVEAGALLLDAGGHVLGFAAALDPVDRDPQVGAGSTSGRDVFPVVAILVAEHGAPARWVADPDLRVMPQPEEGSRLPWLGVEYAVVDEGVADLLGIAAPTRDGRRGLIVIHVHAGSPAERGGIVEGDVLLWARRLGQGSGPPVDLRDAPGAFTGPFWAESTTPWRSRRNAIVGLLEEWGEGASYELAWLRGGQERRGTFEAELAPPDWTSAPRREDPVSGLTVRDLTYEVRSALRVPVGATGVVIAHVEPGSPAAQARLSEHDVILEADGEGLGGAQAFAETLEAARALGRTGLRLVVRRLGKTRLVDLHLGEEVAVASSAGPPPTEEADGDR